MSREAVLMKCGCVAQGIGRKAGETEAQMRPCCVIHDCFEPAESVPDLNGRFAQCSYLPHGHAKKPSSFNLAFFEFRGEGSREATDICKCGYAKVAHLPRWRATIHLVRRWYKIERHEEDVAKDFNCEEADAKAVAEHHADFYRKQTGKHHSQVEVFSAEVTSIVPTRPTIKCSAFTPKGPQEFDNFYCGCMGWD